MLLRNDMSAEARTKKPCCAAALPAAGSACAVSHLFAPSTDPYGMAGDHWEACAMAVHPWHSCGSPN